MRKLYQFCSLHKMYMKFEKTASGRLYPWSRRMCGLRCHSERDDDYGNFNVTSGSRTTVVVAWSVTPD
jgi:hypothetical protein